MSTLSEFQFDGATVAFATLMVWALSVLILFLVIKYAVLDALRVNRRESERDRRG